MFACVCEFGKRVGVHVYIVPASEKINVFALNLCAYIYIYIWMHDILIFNLFSFSLILICCQPTNNSHIYEL